MAKSAISTTDNATAPGVVAQLSGANSVVHTGEETMTGGRLLGVRDYIDDETFCLTYGDGVADINITELTDFHRTEGREATMTVVQPAGRFGRSPSTLVKTEVEVSWRSRKVTERGSTGGFRARAQCHRPYRG